MLRKEYSRPLGHAKTHLFQFDITGAPQNPSGWIVTLEMESADGYGSFPEGAFSQVAVFPSSLETGKNRGISDNGVYVSWYNNGPSHDGYTQLVDEDGSSSRFKNNLQGLRLINDFSTAIAGDVYIYTYEFDLADPQYGYGWTIGVLGGKYAGDISKVTLTISGSVIP